MKKSDAFSIFGIERLRMAIDGKGIRTLVGLSGCPLACKYCINPQANMRSAAIWQFTPQMLIDKLMIDNLYFQSTGGGITFGGGEPLLHIDALSLFSEKCPQTWNLWVETSLYVPSETVNRAAKIFDHFIVDIKTVDAEIYHAYTGGEVSIPLANLKLLLSLVGPQRITVRIPLIPGYTSLDNHAVTVACIKKMGIERIDQFTYIVP